MSTRAENLRNLIDEICEVLETSPAISEYEVIPDIDEVPDWDVADNLEVTIKVDVSSTEYCHDSFTIKVQ